MPQRKHRKRYWIDHDKDGWYVLDAWEMDEVAFEADTRRFARDWLRDHQEPPGKLRKRRR